MEKEIEELNVTRTELVRALAKPGADILATLTPEKCHLIHMAIGLAGEAGEILECEVNDHKNMLEELGDAHFYLEGELQGIELYGLQLNGVLRLATYPDFPEYLSKLPYEISLRMQIAILCGRIIDTVKKYTVYNKPTLEREELLQHMIRLEASLIYLRNYYGFTDTQVHADNLRKLGDRYKKLMYSDKAAIERADKNPMHDPQGNPLPIPPIKERALEPSPPSPIYQTPPPMPSPIYEGGGGDARMVRGHSEHTEILSSMGIPREGDGSEHGEIIAEIIGNPE